MSVEDIYQIVFNIVEEKHTRDLLRVQSNIKDLIKQGVDPKLVSKEEQRLKRELEIEYRAYSKVALVVEIFVKSGFKASDAEIADIIRNARQSNDKIPSLERSSVGRYLTSNKVVYLYGQEIYKQILEARKNNLMAAKSKGGKSFASQNVAVKDELGHFQGSIKK